ncbi:PadR family transcriptional regulator [bacterium]|nr:PadR family transcriptional regulator [bacterium]
MKRPGIEIATLPKNCNEALILAILARGDRHGYQIALELEELSGGVFTFNHGTLYPILHKLEKDGLIRGLWEDIDSGRKRKYYTTTGKGKEYLTQQRAGLGEFFSALMSIIGDRTT